MIFAHPKPDFNEPPSSSLDVQSGLPAQCRVAEVLRANHQFIWRCVRRFGVEPAAVDDVLQEVFIVLSRRLDEVELGKERAFLTQTAFRLAANWRRGVKRRPLTGEINEDLVACDAVNPELELEQRQTRRLLDVALDGLSDEHRAVLVLSEVDGLSRTEVAELLGWPTGTVASRLRLAKEKFADEVNKLWRDGMQEEPRHE